MAGAVSEPLRLASGYKGKTWTIPFLMDTHFLYYRKDIFAAAGLPTEWQPADTAEILSFAQVIKSVVPDVIPYALYAGANGGNGTVSRGFVPLLYANGGTLQDENGLWIIDSCEIRAVLDHYSEAYQGLAVVPQDVMTSSSPSSAMRSAMGAGELGILYEGCWAYGPWLEDEPEQTTEQIGLAQFPVNADDSTFAVGGTGNSWFLNASSQQQDAGWAFIEAFKSAKIRSPSTSPIRISRPGAMRPPIQPSRRRLFCRRWSELPTACSWQNPIRVSAR